MPIRKKTRLWTSIGAAALLAGGVSACGDSSDQAAAPSEQAADNAQADAAPAPAETPAETSPVAGEGEGEGEGEGGGSGGEFGIDPQAAANDPVVFLTAIDVMRAHYYAAIDALEAGDRGATAELLAHPISEIYLDFEPVLQEAGGPDMYETLNGAAMLHFDGAEDAEIRAAIDDILAQFEDAAAVAPESDTTQAAVQGEILSDLIERAALQYQLAVNSAEDTHAYLDGYGLYKAAEKRAETALPAIEGADTDALTTFESALSLLGQAYPDGQKPETPPVPAADVMSASEAATDAAASL